jgi:DNA-directed RNA polymerase III subunit RPC1
MMEDTIPTAKLTGLRFGLLSNEDAQAMTTVELSVLSNKKNISAPHTVNCNSQGPMDSTTLCNQCGNDNLSCQNHPQRITLKHPIINVHFFVLLQKIFSSLCIHCGEVLLPRNHPRLTSKPGGNYKRNCGEMSQLTAKFRYCWFPEDPLELAAAHKKKKKKKKRKKPPKKPQRKRKKANQDPDDASNEDDESEEEEEEEEEQEDEVSPYEQPHLLPPDEQKKRGYCGFRNPNFWSKVENVLLRPIYVVGPPKLKWSEREKQEAWRSLPIITPEQMFLVLKHVSPAVTKLFGFDPVYSPLHAMMIKTMVAPLPIIRPLRSAHGNEDDLTKTTRQIQEKNSATDMSVVPNLTLGLLRTLDTPPNITNTVALKKLERIEGEMSEILKRKKQSVVAKCLDDYFKVQREHACLQDSRYHFNLDREYRKEGFSLKRRFTSSKRCKRGRMHEILGKRGDSCIRGVGAPDTQQDIDCIGVPLKAMMHTTTQEIVTENNYNEMLKLIMNGSSIYPGCNFVQRGSQHFLPDANFGGVQIGDIVHRHLQENRDVAIGNRQPSLWRWSCCGYRLRVHNDSVIKGHLAVTTMLNEDYDGDEKNLYIPQTEEERAEVIHLITVRQNLMKDGVLLVGFVQHSVVGAYKLTDLRTGPLTFTCDEIRNYINIGRNKWCIADTLMRWERFNGSQPLSGREFMHVLLPTYKPSTDSKDGVTKSKLNALLAQTIDTATDMDTAAFRIGFLTRIFESLAYDFGVSLNLDDILMDTPAEVQTEANAVLADAEKFSQDAEKLANASMKSSSSSFSVVGRESATSNQDDSDEVVRQELEDALCSLTEEYRQVLGKHSQDYLENAPFQSGVWDCVQSGAKGSLANIIQNSKVMGQQLNDANQRYPDTTSHFYRSSLARGGFVSSCFLDGLSPTEFFTHLRASRLGIISTSVMTSDSGYLFRKILKNLEDIRTMSDATARNALNQIILFRYGFDTSHLHQVPIKTLAMSIDEVIEKYRTDQFLDEDDADEYDCGVQEVEFLLQRRQHALEMEDVKSAIALPVHFERVFLCSRDFINANHKNQHETPLLESNVPQPDPSKRCRKHKVNLNAARNRVFSMWLTLVNEFHVPNSPLYELVFFENMSTRVLKEKGVLDCMHVFEAYLAYVEGCFGRNVSDAGEAVGMRSSQEMCANLTQATLKKFHLSGQKSTTSNSTTRLKEIVNLTKNIENPRMDIFILPEFENDFKPIALVELRLKQVVQSYSDKLPQSYEKWQEQIRAGTPDHPICNLPAESLVHLTFNLNTKILVARELTPRELAFYISNTQALSFDDGSLAITCSDLGENMWITVSMPRQNTILKHLTPDSLTLPTPLLTMFLHRALVFDKQILAGIEGIMDFVPDEQQVTFSDNTQEGKLVTKTRRMYSTIGTNLAAVCSLPCVDVEFTRTNDIHQTFAVFGIEAAKDCIEEELANMVTQGNVSVSFQHVRLIANAMTLSGYPASMTYAAMMSKGTASNLKLASFERSLPSYISAAICSTQDNLNGISEALICGKLISLGTGGAFSCINLPHPNPLPPRPKPQKIDFNTPNIEGFLTETSTEAFVIDLEDQKAVVSTISSYYSRASKKPKIPRPAGVTKKMQKQQEILKKQKEKEHLILQAKKRGDLPNFFGMQDFFIPTSPKTRKPTTRTKSCNNTKRKRQAAKDEKVSRAKMRKSLFDS